MFMLLAMVMTVLTASAEDLYFSLTKAEGAEEHGEISFKVGGNTVTQAKEGETVTIEIALEEGWAVGSIGGQWYAAIAKAPRHAGDIDLLNEMTLTPAGENKWTFTMQRANVQVSSTYKKLLTHKDITVTVEEATYTGSPVTPAVTLKDGEKVLVKGTDYNTLSFSNNTDAALATDEGAPTVSITALSTVQEYAGTVTKTFTIKKAAATMRFATTSINKSFGDADFTNPLTIRGDGSVTYASDNESVATVDAETGLVHIVGSGNANIIATVVDGKNYTYAVKTAQYAIGVNTAAMTVSADGYTGTYDGEAHTITVTVTEPEGTTVKYGTVAGEYTLDEAPAYTDAGEYTVFYQVTKENYTTVEGSATVSIAKAAATISYETASISKTFGDEDFTNPLTIRGDGSVTYASDNESVATVDAETGLVHIVGSGNANITATVADSKNYTYATKTASYAIGVNTTAMSVTAANYSGTYDGEAHTITVTVTEPEGTTVKFGTVAGEYTLDEAPAYTDAGEYTVFYQVTKENYTTVVASATISIAKAAATISYETASISKTFGDEDFTNALTMTGDGSVTYASDNESVATVNSESGLVHIVGSGNANITATVADGKNYTYATKTAQYAIGVNATAMSVTAANYSGTYDGEAHTITVTVTEPEGTTVKFGTVAGEYTLDEAPAYTDAGEYTVFYQVTKENYTTVEGSATVSIAKAAATISYETASVSKTFGDEDFTNTLTMTGDGSVTYASDNESVATVNSESGLVHIVGSGNANITATVADGKNYTYATKTASYAIGVNTTAMSVTAANYSGTYDGEAHTITVTVTEPEGTTVKFGTVAGEYTLDEAPAYTDAGEYTVFYQVTKENYTTVEGSATVSIAKAAATISYETASVSKSFGDADFTNTLTNTGDGIATYASDNEEVVTVDAETGEVHIVGTGSANITATVADGKNFTYATKTAQYAIGVNATAMSVTAANYSGTYDGEAHTITVTVTEPEGTTVKFGTVAGEYTLDKAPAFTEAGEYTVFYQVTKENYTTVEGSAIVSIAKAAATISYETVSVSKTYGDEDFTNELKNTGDGIATYASDNEEVATVDAETGLVHVVGPGSANITATVADGKNYTYATKTARYAIGVGTAAIVVSAEGFTGTYDGEAHTITVTVTEPEGTTVKYGTVAGEYTLDKAPAFTEAGEYTVFYQVTKENYTTVENSAVVSISKAAGVITFAETTVGKAYGDADFTNELANNGDGTVTYASDNESVAVVNAETGEVHIVGTGSATITATVADGANFTYATKSAQYTLQVVGIKVNVAAGEYITYFESRTALKVVDEGAELYTVTAVEDGKAVLSNASDAMPKNTPFLVKNNTGEEKTFILVPCNDPELAITVADEFIGTLTEKSFTEDDMKAADYYVCNGIEFIKVRGAGAMASNKAYLKVNGNGNPQSIQFRHSIDGGAETTGIDESIVNSEEVNSVWYDLNGRRLQGKPSLKGVYIKNGRKVVVK